MRPFVAWDGEAVLNEFDPTFPDHPYSLFGSSLGWRIRSYDLNTLDCLSLITETEQSCPDAIHFGYAFGYDVNMILRDLPLYTLRNLHRTGKGRYQGFELEYIPRKWFRVAYGRGKGRTTAKIFDTFSFFSTSLGTTLRKYNIGSQEQLLRIDTGKGERPNFQYDDIPTFVEPYWETELVLMVQLMDTFRNILESAGIHINSWHGPGAIANYLLKTHSTHDYMLSSDDAIREAAQFAYFGGRFEAFKAGFYDGPIYSADINSAYPYAHSRLPSLSDGKWVHYLGRPTDHPNNVRLGMYRINYAQPYNPSQAMPLPLRGKSGSVYFPPSTNGWFHAAEAGLVYDSPYAEFLESWIFETNSETYPFDWINELYDERLRLKSIGSPVENGIKLGINSLYGQVAQRVGWRIRNGFIEIPRWHQLDWAGAITSECRAMVYLAARNAGKGLISIDTDGVLSSIPFRKLPNGVGEKLGQWKCTEYTGMFYLQNGIYWLRDKSGVWLPPKSRGIPRKKLAYDAVRENLSDDGILKISQHMFLGFGLALHGQIDRWRHWIDVPREITFGGTGKRIHSPTVCPSCLEDHNYLESLHPLLPVQPKNATSFPHSLPWLETGHGDSTLDYRLALMNLEKWGVFIE